MKPTSFVQIVALLFVTAAAACTVPIDESDADDNVASAEADLGTDADEGAPDADKLLALDDHVPGNEDCTGREDADGPVDHDFEALYDPDPVSWQPPPPPASDESGESPDKD